MVSIKQDIAKQFVAARAVGTPLVMVATSDPAAAIRNLRKEIIEFDKKRSETTGKKVETHVIEWDAVRGVSEASSGALASCFGEGLISPVDFLQQCRNDKVPERTVIFAHNLRKFANDPVTAQAIWNLRDNFKARQRVLVIVGSDGTLPPEIANDVLVLDEPLPTNDELSEIVKKTHKFARREIDEPSVQRAIEAVRGLAAFPAEQAVAMSISKETGLDFDALWERKRRMIEQCPGLSVFRSGEKFDDVGGCENIKDFLRSYIGGKARPNVVVFFDEIEKQLAGIAGDLSGTSQDQNGAMLSYMQNHNCAGLLFIGPPGAAKSAMSKAIGNECGCPTIEFDLGACKGSLVGESEERIRAALKTVTAVGNDRALFVATCNNIGALPNELLRRFPGKFFFDLPTAEERKLIWAIWMKKFEIAEQEMPNDHGWTGAEIRQCCMWANDLNKPLKEVARGFVIPVSLSEKIEALRRESNGKYISASKPGPYEYHPLGQLETESNGEVSRMMEWAAD